MIEDETTPLLRRDDDDWKNDGLRTDEDKSSLNPKEWLLVGILSCAGFLNVFTAQSTIIMLPSIGESYNIPTKHQHLITSIYNVSSGSLILLFSRLADVYGRKIVFLAGCIAYTISSGLLPFSPNATIFFLFRALQGISVASAVLSSIGIVTSTFPAGKRRNYAFVYYNATSSLGAVLGNIVGGIIGGYLSWRWVFWSAALTSIVIAPIGYVLVPSRPRTAKPQSEGDQRLGEQQRFRPYVDWFGGLLITVTLMAIMVTLSSSDGWNGPQKWMQMAGSVTLAYIFIAWQRHLELGTARQPLIKTSLFCNAKFSAALAAYACFLASYNTFLVYVSFFFQQYQRLSVLEATLRFTPSGISAFLVCFATAPLLSRIRNFNLLVVATIFGIISPLLFALPSSEPPPTSSSSASYTYYLTHNLPSLCLAMSIEILAPVMSLFVVKCLPATDQALGGGLLQTANNLGKAVGLAMAAGVQAVVMGWESSSSVSPSVSSCSSVVAGDGCVAVYDSGVGTGPDLVLLGGIRAAQWVNVGFGVMTLLLSIGFLRDL